MFIKFWFRYYKPAIGGLFLSTSFCILQLVSSFLRLNPILVIAPVLGLSNSFKYLHSPQRHPKADAEASEGKFLSTQLF